MNSSNLANNANKITPADVQNEVDNRSILINEVGIRDIKYPVAIKACGNIIAQTCSANWTMTVELPSDKKGTHMSRFIEILEIFRSQPLDLVQLKNIFSKMQNVLHTVNGKIDVSFPFFVEKKAPVSQTKSLMDYEGGFLIAMLPEHRQNQSSIEVVKIWVKVPVTSLCPCSKKISDYGAHNQRSAITLIAEVKNCSVDFGFIDLINIAEKSASSELYGILKRPDEKYVTEYAYNHPKFVEDLVRDMTVELKKSTAVKHYEVIAENFESIHNHTAYAVVRG